MQIHWILAMNTQGLTRLDKWFTPHNQVQLPSKRVARLNSSHGSIDFTLLYPQHERNRIKKEMSTTLLKRHRLMCNFVTWREYTVVYKRCVPLLCMFSNPNSTHHQRKPPTDMPACTLCSVWTTQTTNS